MPETISIENDPRPRAVPCISCLPTIVHNVCGARVTGHQCIILLLALIDIVPRLVPVNRDQITNSKTGSVCQKSSISATSQFLDPHTFVWESCCWSVKNYTEVIETRGSNVSVCRGPEYNNVRQTLSCCPQQSPLDGAASYRGPT